MNSKNINNKILLIILLFSIVIITYNYVNATANKFATNDLTLTNKKIKLTKQEEEWIKNNSQITVAMMKSYPPFSFVAEGTNEVEGFTKDLIYLVAEKTGLEINLEVGFWDNNLAKFKANKVDVITNISYQKEREEFTLYTEPYYQVPLVTYIRQDSNWYQAPKDLAKKKIGLLKDAFYNSEIKAATKGEIIEIENNEELIDALAFGKVDAVITNLSVGKFYIQKNALNNIKLAGEYSNSKVKKEDLRIGVQKDNPILRGIIQKGLNAVSETEWMKLKDKWLGIKGLEREEEKWINRIAGNNKINNLTIKEQEYLRNKAEILIAVNPNWMPFERINQQGEYEGIVAQFYKLLSKKIDLPIKLVKTDSWAESVSQVKNQQVDLLSTAVKKRESGIKFTQSYINYPLVIATRQEEIYISNLKAVKDKKIGLSKDCPLFAAIQKEYPQIDFIKVKDTKSGLEQVNNGQLFGLINTAPAIGYIIQQENMFDLKVSGELEEELKLRIGVRSDDQVLLNILKKTLKAVNKKEKEAIFNNWLAINYEQGFNYSLFIKLMLGVALIGLFVLYRQYQLKRFNQKLSSLNEELGQANQKLEDMSFIDGLTQIPNRRKFDEVLKKEWKHCKREQHPLSLLMLDLDFFKQFNDRYGHLTGDDCLKQIAKTIEACIKRPKDLAARYGGEEFIVILPETKAEGAKEVANRMQAEIINLEIEHQDSKVAPYVTVSLGVATMIPNEEVSTEEFVDLADSALYQAKENGRNRINYCRDFSSYQE